MPEEAQIDFTNRQETSSTELAGGKPFAVNIVSDPKRGITRRPGVRKVAELTDQVIDPDGIVGIHRTVGGRLYVLGGTQRLYQVGTGSAAQIPISPAGALTRLSMGQSRPVFAETELLLLIAGGGIPWKVEFATNLASELAGSPPRATHITALASRLVANDVLESPNTLRFSSVAGGNSSFAGHEQWTFGVGTAGALSGEANPDAITAIVTNANELFVFGQRSMQVFSPDPGFTYATVATREWGLLGPYSVVVHDQSLAFLATPRRFILTDGRSSEAISDSIQTTLDELEVVDDCFGFRVRLGALDGIVWVFPTEGRAFCWQKGAGWGEWSGWDREIANFSALSINAFTQLGSTPLVGTLEGRVGELSFAASTDYGAELVGRVRTAFDNRGTDARKRCKGVRIRLLTGKTSGPIPRGWLRWRDSLGIWKGEIPISFGAAGETEVVIQKRSLGTYRSRQWEWEASGPDQTSLASVTEEYEVLPC